jgi:hypothetical protein
VDTYREAVLDFIVTAIDCFGTMFTFSFNHSMTEISFLFFTFFPHRYSMFLSPPSTLPPTHTTVCLWRIKGGSRRGTALWALNESLLLTTHV